MTDPTSDETVRSLLRAFTAVTDPDPERQLVACPDCLTPQVSLTEAEGVGSVLGIAHDESCPAYAAMTADERTVMVDDGAIVHVVRSETDGGKADA